MDGGLCGEAVEDSGDKRGDAGFVGATCTEGGASVGGGKKDGNYSGQRDSMARHCESRGSSDCAADGEAGQGGRVERAGSSGRAESLVRIRSVRTKR